MNKKVIGIVTAIVAVVVLTGCEQIAQTTTTQPQVNEVQNQIEQSQYVVDESDNIKPHTLLSNTPAGELSDAEKAGLIQMREEEKLAHDVYVTLYEKWGQNIFNNILKSEQTHTDTVKYILDKYKIEDPVKDITVGVFTSSQMQGLYDSLVEQGNKSLIDALVVGATIEDLDIDDLNKLLAQTDNEDIKIAYQNLNRGSHNHMRAFTRNLERNGGKYSPQYISEEEYQEIISGEQERGDMNSQGQRRGQGQGKGGGQGKNRM